MPKEEKILIFDGNAIVHRAYHALPPLANKKGEQTGAVYGFLLVFFKALKDFNPEYLAACFDFPGPSFRKNIDKEYKANRKKADPELYAQIPFVKKILNSFNVKIFEEKGFEADDLIGTISSLCSKKKNLKTFILSGDRDVLQLVRNNVLTCLLKQGVKGSEIFDCAAVEKKYGITPFQLVDYKALSGDASDNISGIKGIGPKTAAEILKKFFDLDSLYEEIEKPSKKVQGVSLKTKEMLLSQKEKCITSRTLAKIKTDVPIIFDIEECRRQEEAEKNNGEILEGFGFSSLAKRFRENEKNSSCCEKKDFKKNLKLW